MAACVVLASPLPFASRASAGALATLHANPQQQVQVGGTITLFGRNYSNNAAASDIEIRLDGREGPVIASFSPRSTIGAYQTTAFAPFFIRGEPVTIPVSTSVGSHLLVATQFNTRGEMISGGPGRTTIEVTASRSAAGAAAAAAPAPARPAASPARMAADRLAAGARSPLVLAIGFSLLALLFAMRHPPPARLLPRRQLALRQHPHHPGGTRSGEGSPRSPSPHGQRPNVPWSTAGPTCLSSRWRSDGRWRSEAQ